MIDYISILVISYISHRFRDMASFPLKNVHFSNLFN